MDLRKLIWLTSLVVLASLPSSAAFPGKNGRIAFVQDADIFTMNPDGSDVRQFTALGDGNFASWARWSADGKLIVFSEFLGPDFFGQIWTMNADGSNQHQLLNDPGFDDEAPSFSTDGSQIIFERCAPLDGEFPCAIYRIQSDGSGLTQLTPVRIELADFEPEYSPDGGTVAFYSFGRDGIISAIYLMNADGTNIRQVSDAELEGYAPDWSPDGRQLLFVNKCCNAENSNLMVMRPDGQRPRQITQNTGAANAFRGSWSPQGDAIVFRNRNRDTGEDGLYILDAASGGKKQILSLKPSSTAKRSARAASQTRQLNSKKLAPITKIEDGGMVPHWGTAQ